MRSDPPRRNVARPLLAGRCAHLHGATNKIEVSQTSSYRERATISPESSRRFLFLQTLSSTLALKRWKKWKPRSTHVNVRVFSKRTFYLNRSSGAFYPREIRLVSSESSSLARSPSPPFRCVYSTSVVPSLTHLCICSIRCGISASHVSWPRAPLEFLSLIFLPAEVSRGGVRSAGSKRWRSRA